MYSTVSKDQIMNFDNFPFSSVQERHVNKLNENLNPKRHSTYGKKLRDFHCSPVLRIRIFYTRIRIRIQHFDNTGIRIRIQKSQ